MFRELSFTQKLSVLEEVYKRYSPDYLKWRFSEYEGEVPLRWFMPEEEIAQIVAQVKGSNP